jgi:hypothetical protein
MVTADIQELDALGAEHVLFDWYVSGDMESARDDGRGWSMLTLLAEQVVNLPAQGLR